MINYNVYSIGPVVGREPKQPLFRFCPDGIDCDRHYTRVRTAIAVKWFRHYALRAVSHMCLNPNVHTVSWSVPDTRQLCSEQVALIHRWCLLLQRKEQRHRSQHLTTYVFVCCNAAVCRSVYPSHLSRTHKLNSCCHQHTCLHFVKHACDIILCRHRIKVQRTSSCTQATFF